MWINQLYEFYDTLRFIHYGHLKWISDCEINKPTGSMAKPSNGTVDSIEYAFKKNTYIY